MRVNLYVDGFNLYYRLLRSNSGTKWLDLDSLARRLFPNDTVGRVKYFTAKIKTLDDPDAPHRQQVYLRALNTVPNVSIHYGYFQINKQVRRLRYPIKGFADRVSVKSPEEKGSDVNLATHLVADAFKGEYDMAAVLTNDADHSEPIRMVNHEIGIPVTVVYPTEKPVGALVKANPSRLMKLRPGTVRKAQFPTELTDPSGTFRKPKSW